MNEQEEKIFKFGMIVGELETLAEFNTKANNGYDFNLVRLPKTNDLDSIVANRICYLTDSFELNKIENQNAFKYFKTDEPSSTFIYILTLFNSTSDKVTSWS